MIKEDNLSFLSIEVCLYHSPIMLSKVRKLLSKEDLPAIFPSSSRWIFLWPNQEGLENTLLKPLVAAGGVAVTAGSENV